ncbi:poly [ADP-ribose] polymerase 11-like protein [Labeo rohita]|uniref:Poly [ADP-ribose] polymerase 11-like protein n=1 Tax=Labeo rohita TaxID=84645 RepID=A0A498L9W0_LABRO|nr:poly [ADP-ribose] polymerase 11-like protein [Labeo rohita]
MDTSDTPWYWYYKEKCGVWHRVEDDPTGFMSSDELERYYLRNPQGVITMATTGGQFQINFAASTQVNLKTGKTKRIKRSFQTENGFRCKCDDISPSSPAHWEDVDPKKPYQLISLRKDSSEYQKVERFVRDAGLLHDPIVSIKRIQNLDLWELFCSSFSKMLCDEFAGLVLEDGVEYMDTSDTPWYWYYKEKCGVWHRVESFMSSDDLERYYLRNPQGVITMTTAGCHVRINFAGTYFAKHASFANNYSANTGLGTKVMLLARVIVGKYKTGRQDYCTPDDDLDERIHDSCVDDMLCPRIFVIFDSNQIYPEYLIEYRSN